MIRTALAITALLIVVPSASWEATWAVPAGICGLASAGDVVSTDRALSAGAREMGPFKSEPGRIGAHVAACAATTWLDVSIQRSAHPHRVWILRAAVLGTGLWLTSHNLRIAAHPVLLR